MFSEKSEAEELQPFLAVDPQQPLPLEVPLSQEVLLELPYQEAKSQEVLLQEQAQELLLESPVQQGTR